MRRQIRGRFIARLDAACLDAAACEAEPDRGVSSCDPVAQLTETGGGSAWRAFFVELRRLGYIEGENLIIERASAEGHHERYADMAREIVSSHPDLIVTGTNPVVTIFKAATDTIPLVAFMLDPLKAGLVASLARPGGNLTGITLDAGIEIWAKRLELLKEAIPRPPRSCFSACATDGKGLGQSLREVSSRLGIALVSWSLTLGRLPRSRACSRQ